MTRFTSVLFLIGALCLAGCEAAGPELPLGPKNADSAIIAPPSYGDPSDIVVTFDCADGSNFTARFRNEAGTAIIEQAGAPPLTLYIAATGSGYGYMDRGYELRGKGDDARWTVPGKPALQCKARPTS